MKIQADTGQKIRVWDLPTRVFHWSIVVLFIVSWISAEIGGTAMQYHLWSGYAILVLVIFRILWGVVGAARTCLIAALDYSLTREIFNKPVAAFQLTQKKFADMAVELGKAHLLALHLGRRKELGQLQPAQISFGKLNNVREALAIAREARTILGANGISLDFAVMRHMQNLESVLTYEGTSEIHTLALGQALSGISAYR